MTLVDVNSSELDLILSSLKREKQRLLEKQPLPQPIEERPYEIQYLVEKLEDIFC